MKIIVSEYNGFCGGVKAAVLKADKILNDEKKTILLRRNNSQQRCC
jgi:4-hydroxy-3-methylbut-2-enyl diphosphate reductase IspH